MGTYLANPVTFHQYFARRKHFASGDIEDACRVQNSGVSFGLLRRRSDRAPGKVTARIESFIVQEEYCKPAA